MAEVTYVKLVAKYDDVYSKDSRSFVQKRIEQPRSLLPINSYLSTEAAGQK